MRLRAFEFGTAAALALTLGLAGCGATDEPPEGVQPADAENGEGRRPAYHNVDEDGRNSAGGIVAAPASPASFGDAGQPPAFPALDTDGDGEISSREIDAAPASLATLDADGDGRLSGDELRPRGGGTLGDLPIPSGATVAFMPLGAGGDGALRQPPPGSMTLGADGGGVDLADLPPEFQSLLSAVDADGDGVASATELLALMPAGGAGGPAQGTDGPAAPSAQAGDSSGQGPRPNTPLMAALDADGDGEVSRSEIASAPQALRALDVDGDERLTPDELRPAPTSDSSGGDPRQ